MGLFWHPRRFRTLICAAFASAALTGCHRNIHISLHEKKYSETFQKRFLAQKVRLLRVVGNNGDIQIEPAPAGVEEILIVATKSLRGDKPEAELKKIASDITVAAALKEDALVVSAHWEKTRLKNIDASIAYRIQVPARMALDIEANNGDISISQIAGSAHVTSNNGDLNLKEVTGSQEVHLGSGSIEVEKLSSKGAVIFRTDNGDINLRDTVADALTLASQSGNIAFQGDAAQLSIDATNGNIEADFKTATPLAKAHIAAINGTIDLALPKNINADLQSRVVNGNIRLEGTGDDAESENTLAKKLGKGGAPIELQSTNGNIDIDIKADP